MLSSPASERYFRKLLGSRRIPFPAKCARRPEPEVFRGRARPWHGLSAAVGLLVLGIDEQSTGTFGADTERSVERRRSFGRSPKEDDKLIKLA